MYAGWHVGSSSNSGWQSGALRTRQYGVGHARLQSGLVARNGKAADAALAYCKAAVARLAELDVSRWDDFRCDWTRRGDLFVRRVQAEAAIDLVSHRDKLHRLPEFAAAVGAIEADAEMGKQFGPWVGTVLGAGISRAEDMVDEILRAGISPDDPLRVDEEGAIHAYEERERALYAQKVRYTFLAPLLGLEAEDLPIELAEAVEIDALRDEEIERCLSAGLLSFGDSPVVPVGAPVGLRVTYALPKRIRPEHEQLLDLGEQAGTIYHELTGHLERATQALRLLKSGAVGSRGYAFFADDPHLGTGSWDPLGGPRNFANYTLASSENAAVRELWAMLSAHEVINHTTLLSAVRRFIDARDRRRPEDELIDLMIAAETLFLPGEDQNQDPDYKLGLRAAFFLADLGRPRAATFAHMKRAYTASRAIVHGSELGTLELDNGRQVELYKFIDETSELMREALAQALRVVRDTGGDALLDFDRPILCE